MKPGPLTTFHLKCSQRFWIFRQPRRTLSWLPTFVCDGIQCSPPPSCSGSRSILKILSACLSTSNNLRPHSLMSWLGRQVVLSVPKECSWVAKMKSLYIQAEEDQIKMITAQSHPKWQKKYQTNQNIALQSDYNWFTI